MYEFDDDPYYGYEPLSSQPQGVDQVPFDESYSLPYRPRTTESFAPIPLDNHEPRVDHKVEEDFTDALKQDEAGGDIPGDDEWWMDWKNNWESTYFSKEQMSPETLAATQESSFAETHWHPRPNGTTPEPGSSSNSLPGSQFLRTAPDPLVAVGGQFPCLFDTSNKNFLRSSSPPYVTLSTYEFAEKDSSGEALDFTRPASPMDDSYLMQELVEQPQSFTPADMGNCPRREPVSLEDGFPLSSNDSGQVHRLRHVVMDDQSACMVPPPAKTPQDHAGHEQIPPLLRVDTQCDGVRQQRSWSCRDLEQVAELDTMMDECHGDERREQYSQPPALRTPEINVPPVGTMKRLTPNMRLTPGLSSAGNSLLSPYSTTPFSPFLGPPDDHESIHFYTRSTSNPTTPSNTATTSSDIDFMSSPPSPSPSISSVRSLDSALQCPVCHKDISNSKRYKDRKSNLRRHMRVKHGNGPKPTCSEPGCGKIFERSDALAKHRKNHHRL